MQLEKETLAYAPVAKAMGAVSAAPATKIIAASASVKVCTPYSLLNLMLSVCQNDHCNSPSVNQSMWNIVLAAMVIDLGGQDREAGYCRKGDG